MKPRSILVLVEACLEAASMSRASANMYRHNADAGEHQEANSARVTIYAELATWLDQLCDFAVGVRANAPFFCPIDDAVPVIAVETNDDVPFR